MGLSERRRSQFEAEGRVKITGDEANILAISKAVHVFAIIVTVPITIWMGSMTGTLDAWWFPLLPFLVGGEAEAFALGAQS